MIVEQVTTGVREFDRILCGGFPANSTTMIIGEPGTGKTILAQGFIYANCRDGRKGLYLTTAAEPLDKNLRYVQGFSFFRPEAVQEEVIYEDLSRFMTDGGFEAALDRITTLLREHEPDFLVMDSFKSFTTFAGSERDFHHLLHRLASIMTNTPLTALWVGEYTADDLSVGPEFAVVDGVVELNLQKSGVRDLRHLRVTKMRGTDFTSGEHAMRITADGLEVFPRLTTPGRPSTFQPHDERFQTGVSLLDTLLPGGPWRGTTTVVFGPPGVGKTLVALEFVLDGIRRREKGLIVGFQENPGQLERFAKSFGWEWDAAVADGLLSLMYESPINLFIDEIVGRLLDTVNAKGVSRLVVDTLNDLERAAPDKVRFHEFMYALTQRLSQAGTTTLLTNDNDELFTDSVTTPYGISYMSDNILLLNYVRDGATVRRACAMVKSRGTEHDATVRLFTVGDDGTAIGEPTSLGPVRS